jgi:hypothetical protein
MSRDLTVITATAAATATNSNNAAATIGASTAADTNISRPTLRIQTRE